MHRVTSKYSSKKSCTLYPTIVVFQTAFCGHLMQTMSSHMNHRLHLLPYFFNRVKISLRYSSSIISLCCLFVLPVWYDIIAVREISPKMTTHGDEANSHSHLYTYELLYCCCGCVNTHWSALHFAIQLIQQNNTIHTFCPSSLLLVSFFSPSSFADLYGFSLCNAAHLCTLTTSTHSLCPVYIGVYGTLGGPFYRDGGCHQLERLDPAR